MESPAKKAIVIGMDGASMEIVKNLADWGHMPNIAKLMERGAWRPMIGVFPTLTPPGWTAIATGSWPGNHEVMDFNIRAPGQTTGPDRLGHQYGSVQIRIHLEHL